MSLINDALKRAQQAESKKLATADGPSLHPVETMRSSSAPDLLIPLLVIALLALAGLLISQWFLANRGIQQVGARTLTIPVSAPAVMATAAPVVQPAPVVAAPAVPIATAIVAAPAPVVPPAPPKPAYKLQSIFYFSQNPSAVINSKTVFVGSRVGEARVLAIGQESATIVLLGGQTNVLELP